MESLRGKAALVTGSSTGIGAAAAVELAKHGVKVAITGRDEDGLQETLAKCIQAGASSNHVCIVKADLMKEEEIKVLVDTVTQTFGCLHILVNNAGYGKRVTLEEMTMEDYDRIFTVNVRSMVFITRLCLPHLRRSKGNVVNISSTFVKCPSFKAGAYCMSKAAVDMFTKVLAVELGRAGVRVNCVSPGGVHTDLMARSAAVRDTEYSSHLDKCHPLARQGNTEEIARVIAFICSDAASFMSGSICDVDGGLSATSVLSTYEFNKAEDD